MKLPQRLRRTVRRKVPSPSPVDTPDAWRWLTLLVLLIGLVVLFWPKDAGLRHWNGAWHRWNDARSVWAQEAQRMSDRENLALNDARQVQKQVQECTQNKTLAPDDCLREQVASPLGSLGQLVVARAWDQAIDQPSFLTGPRPQRTARLRSGLDALDALQRLSLADTAAWSRLTDAFQADVNACAAVLPGLLCSWWAQGDEQTWGLSWDMANGVVLPSPDVQAIPSFVNDRRQAWTGLLSTVRRPPAKERKPQTLSTNRPSDALSEEAPNDDARDRGRFRSDRARERESRPPLVEQRLEGLP